MHKIPMEWVDRIFKRLVEIYGSSFSKQFIKPSYIEIAKTQWQSGLQGVTAEEIKEVIQLCWKGFIPDPPNVIEFYHYCKKIRFCPGPKKTSYTLTDSQKLIAEQYIKLITDKLHGRITNSDGDAALSTLSQQVLGYQACEVKGHGQDD